MPEVPNGWLPPWALASLSVRVGPVAARRLVWASEPITGTEAYGLKLADYLVPQADVESQAIALAGGSQRCRGSPSPAPNVSSRRW